MIRVIIEREIAEGLEQYYHAAVSDLLKAMTDAPGYLSGESLVEISRPNHYVVLTRWANEEAWQRWFKSPQRQQFLDAIRPFMLNDEKFMLLRQRHYNDRANPV